MPGGALVRRRVASNALALAAYHPYAKRARTAYTVGKTLYANRGRIKWAAKKIGRAWRARKKRKAQFSRKNIGEPIGSSNAKADLVVNVIPGQFDSRTLITHNLTEIPEGTTTDTRIRKIINLRGFKICAEFSNTQTIPLYLNVAVLSPKQKSTVDGNDFFRDDGSDDNRAQNFSSITLNSLQFHCLPINTDDYIILKHRRYKLNPVPNGTTFAAQNGKNYMNIDWWIPLKRQLRYDTLSGGPENGTVHLVYWCARFGDNLSGVQTNACQRTVRATAYFRENWGF